MGYVQLEIKKLKSNINLYSLPDYLIHLKKIDKSSLMIFYEFLVKDPAHRF